TRRRGRESDAQRDEPRGGGRVPGNVRPDRLRHCRRGPGRAQRGQPRRLPVHQHRLGLAVTMGVYVAGGVSGAHLNPAVTLALAARRGFAWAKVIPYSLAQIAGAFSASAVVFFVYREAFDHFDGGTRVVAGAKATAGIFATYPQPFLSSFGGVVDQIVGTALLMLVILAIGDARNNAP